MVVGEAPLNIWSFCVVMADAPVFTATAAVRGCEFCAREQDMRRARLDRMGAAEQLSVG